MRVRHLFACLALALCGWMQAASAVPTELLTNGSFESPVNATFGPAPTNWSIGAPEPSVVNYPWLQLIWSLNGTNPAGSQIAALNGNCRQTVGTLLANRYYTLSFWVYFRSNQQFYADLTTTPWSGGLVRAINDGGTIQNLPNPLPIGQWTKITIAANTIAPAFAAQVGQPLYVHFWSTGPASEILLDDVSLLVDTDPPAPTNYYVSFSLGNDTNNGTSPATPWKTFANVNARTFNPGDNVLLRRGDTWASSQLVLNGKGTSGSPITLSAYGTGANPIITGQNLTTAAVAILQNPSDVNVDSLDLRDGKVGLYLRYSGGNTDGTGAMFNNNAVTVTGCNFQNFDEVWSDGSGNITVAPPYELSWGAGIWIGGSIPAPPGGPWPSESTNILDGLTVRHCSFQQCSTGVGNNWYFPTVTYRERLRNVMLEDSWVTGCENGSLALFYVAGGWARRFDSRIGGNGFYATGTTGGFVEDCINFTIDNCEFAFNKQTGGNDGVGFDYEGNTSNVAFTNNVIQSNDGSGMLNIDTGGGNLNFVMDNNTFYNNCRNPKDSGQNNELRASANNTGSFTNNGVYRGAANAFGTPALYNNTSRWQGYTGGAATRTGTDYATVAARPLTWGFASSVEGWGSANNWTGLAASGGALVGTSNGTDPYVASASTWVNSRRVDWVRVRMSQTAGANGQIFFATETFPTFSGSRVASFPIIADGTMREYIVDLRTVADYKGVVTQWRLDPTDASGSTMAIDLFEAHTEPLVRQLANPTAATVDVVFNEPMLPQGGVLNPANYTVGGAGRGSVAVTPDHVTPIATPTGILYRLGWNSGSMSGGGTLTVNVANAQDALGNAAWPGTGATITAVPVELSAVSVE